MADRLISADTLRAAMYHALPYTHIHALGVDVESYECGWNDALDAVADSAPTVDAVPVVRCKDCRFHRGEYCVGKGHFDMPTEDDGFCSWGKEKMSG